MIIDFLFASDRYAAFSTRTMTKLAALRRRDHTKIEHLPELSIGPWYMCIQLWHDASSVIEDVRRTLLLRDSLLAVLHSGVDRSVGIDGTMVQ
jgi:hypothetical protein